MEINFIFSLKEGESFSRPLDPVWFERNRNGIIVRATDTNETLALFPNTMSTDDIETEIKKMLGTYGDN